VKALGDEGSIKAWDSPMEEMFHSAWDNIRVPFGLRLRYQVALISPITGRFYRPDFIVTPADEYLGYNMYLNGVEEPRIAIEIDGHAFHEKTREQVTYRNRRDRYLQTRGWVVLHFSGSEVFRDAKACAREVARFAAHAYFRAMEDLANA